MEKYLIINPFLRKAQIFNILNESKHQVKNDCKINDMKIIKYQPLHNVRKDTNHKSRSLNRTKPKIWPIKIKPVNPELKKTKDSIIKSKNIPQTNKTNNKIIKKSKKNAVSLIKKLESPEKKISIERSPKSNECWGCNNSYLLLNLPSVIMSEEIKRTNNLFPDISQDSYWREWDIRIKSSREEAIEKTEESPSILLPEVINFIEEFDKEYNKKIVKLRKLIQNVAKQK